MYRVTVTVPLLASQRDRRVRAKQRLSKLDGEVLDDDLSEHLPPAEDSRLQLRYAGGLYLDLILSVPRKQRQGPLRELRDRAWALLLDGTSGWEVGKLFVAVNALGSADELEVSQVKAPKPKDGALLRAAQRGSRAGVIKAIEAGEPLDAQDRKGNTALHLALVRGHGELALLLIERGAPLELRNGEGRTPLLAYVTRLAGPQAEVLEALLAAGADPAVIDDYGYDALMDSARRGDLPWLERFLALGLDPNRLGGGKRPLWWVNDGDTLRLLLARGADPALRDGEGRTLREYLVEGRDDPNRFNSPERWQGLIDALDEALDQSPPPP